MSSFRAALFFFFFSAESRRGGVENTNFKAKDCKNPRPKQRTDFSRTAALKAKEKNGRDYGQRQKKDKFFLNFQIFDRSVTLEPQTLYLVDQKQMRGEKEKRIEEKKFDFVA